MIRNPRSSMTTKQVKATLGGIHEILPINAWMDGRIDGRFNG